MNCKCFDGTQRLQSVLLEGLEEVPTYNLQKWWKLLELCVKTPNVFYSLSGFEGGV